LKWFLRALLLAAFLFVSHAAYAVGQATGRVTGTIIEATSQAPVPGALITLTGGSGVNQRTQTGDDGTFELSSVPPGTYDFVVTYESLKPVKRRVVVNPDAATPVNIVWTAEAEKEETTVVEEERHLTNPDSPQTGQIMAVDRINRLPISPRLFFFAMPQIPGVTSGTNNPTVKGARSNNNRYLVNGLDTTDPTTNQQTANFPQDALESLNVTTGGFEAKYNAIGSVIAVQTRRGTNEFHGAASAYWAPQDLVIFDTYGPQLYNAEKTNDFSAVQPKQQRYEVNLSAQGPILKNHLFFNAGIRFERSQDVQPSGPPRFVQAQSRTFNTLYTLAGITFVPVDSHRIHVEGFLDPSEIEFQDNASTVANTTNPYSQSGRSQGGRRMTLEWAWQASKHVSTKVMFGINQTKLDFQPMGIRDLDAELLTSGPYDFQRPAHTNRDDSTVWFNVQNRDFNIRRRYQLDASVTGSFEGGGKHEAEFGVQSAILEQRQVRSFTGGTSTQDDSTGYGISYTDRNGGPLDTGLCDLDPRINPGASVGQYSGAGCFRRTYSRSFAAHQSGNQFGTYLQDRFKPVKWLTILPGVRFDTGTVRATDSIVAQTAFGFGPRFSIIADVTGDQKTILQASYGRTTEMPALGGVANYDITRRNLTTTEQYNAATRRFEFFQNTGGQAGARLNFDRVAASNDEILLSARREIAQGMLLRVDYTYRYIRRQYEASEVNAIMDVTGTRTIGFLNGVPTRVTEYGFNPQSTAQYSGLDLILETRLKNVEIQGNYTLSQSWGTAGSGAFDNPRFADFYHGYQVGVDQRHAIKSSTTFTILPGFTIGVILNWRSGVALMKGYGTSETGYTIRRAPAGYTPGAAYNTGTGNPGQLGTFSDVRSWASFRSPDLLTANLMLTYDFHALIKQHLLLNLQINNVLALGGATGVVSQEGTPNTNQFGLASGRQSFRTFTLGARYEF
jgi:hypothetical protein